MDSVAATVHELLIKARVKFNLLMYSLKIYKAERCAIMSSKNEINESLKNFRRSIFVLVLGLIGWPIGLFIHPWASFIFFAVLTTMGGVGSYISFMHYLSAKNRQP